MENQISMWTNLTQIPLSSEDDLQNTTQLLNKSKQDLENNDLSRQLNGKN